MFKNLTPERKHMIKIVVAQGIVTAATLIVVGVLEKKFSN